MGGYCFSTDIKDNPIMHDWNVAYLKYCDGGSFSGLAKKNPRGERHTSLLPRRLYPRGRCSRQLAKKARCIFFYFFHFSLPPLHIPSLFACFSPTLTSFPPIWFSYLPSISLAPPSPTLTLYTSPYLALTAFSFLIGPFVFTCTLLGLLP